MQCEGLTTARGLEYLTMARADVLHHARSSANGGNVHRIESTIQAYVFACEDLRHVMDASLLMPKSRAIRQRLTHALAGVERMESQLWAV